MKVEAVALADFVHGDINAIEGRVCRHRNGDLLDSGLAGDLERANLVRIRMMPAMTRAPAPEGKLWDDGLGQPSSASDPAPVLPMTMSNELKRGPGRPRKDGA